jgi:tRNA threonylcarbamoyladenosine biosynthesis protein TsaB
MYLLSIDASTKFCSVAIHLDGAEVFSANNLTEKSASSILTVLVQTAVDAVGIKVSDIDAFAVAKGPGSYTGLRVAVSVVKGLCFALDKPLISVNTLEAMTRQVRKGITDAGMLVNKSDILYVPMIDARRMEVYCSIYDSMGKEVKETHPLIVGQDSFDSWLSENRLLFFGDGAAKCRAFFEDRENAFFWNSDVHPLAVGVGDLAWGKFERNELEDLSAFEPFYLKEFMGARPVSVPTAT